MGISLVTPPTEWPVTLAEAKVQCRVTHDDEDAYLEGLIRAATTYVESTLGRTIAVRTWKLTLDEFADAIEILRGPVQSVDAVQYSDEDGLTQTASASLYSTDLVSSRQWVLLNTGESWPTTLDGVNAVSVTYTAGYEPADVPADIRHAILLLIGHWYANREAASDKPATTTDLAVDALLQPYRAVLV